jgi:hypothetical protein
MLVLTMTVMNRYVNQGSTAGDFEVPDIYMYEAGLWWVTERDEVGRMT